MNNLFNTVSNIERVGDHAENLAELAQNRIDHNVDFTKDAQRELKEITEVAIKCFENAVLSRESENVDNIRKVVKYEDVVDTMEEDYRERHISRLSNKECDTEAGIIFIDALINLERMADHSLNIAGFVKDEME